MVCDNFSVSHQCTNFQLPPSHRRQLVAIVVLCLHEACMAIGTRVCCASLIVMVILTQLSHRTRIIWLRLIVVKTNDVRTTEPKNEAPQLMRVSHNDTDLNAF